jgi:hypothetical protein
MEDGSGDVSKRAVGVKRLRVAEAPSGWTGISGGRAESPKTWLGRRRRAPSGVERRTLS